MTSAEQQRFPPRMKTLQQLPQEILETIAEFCGNVASVSPSEQTDAFTQHIINSYLDSSASNTWSPAYSDLRALALVSRTFSNPAQRALFKVAMVKTTGDLMRLLRSLLLYPNNRRYVRCFVAAINDHVRLIPCRFITPRPLVLGEFLFYIYPLLSTTAVKGLPHDSFFHRTVPRFQGTLQRLNHNKLHRSLSRINTTARNAINLHTLEDQVVTATIQLCPKLTATRLCFGAPHRYLTELSQPASQPVHNPPIYATLLDSHQHLRLKSLSLDFGALLSLTNIKRYVPGYPTGLPPCVERLTLVGNETNSELSYHLFDLDIFGKWLRTNSRLRELRMLDGFDKLVTYKRFRNNHPQAENWNSILLAYRETLELLVMDWYLHVPFGLFPEARFGPSKILDCLPQMQKLRYIRVPLHALGGSKRRDLVGREQWKFIGLVPDRLLPPRCRKMDLMVVNPPVPGSGEERMRKKWKVIEYWPVSQLL